MIIAVDQSAMSKNICYKRRDDMTGTAAGAADDTLARTVTTTTLSTPPHVVVCVPGDQQSVAVPAQVSPILTVTSIDRESGFCEFIKKIKIHEFY